MCIAYKLYLLKQLCKLNLLLLDCEYKNLEIRRILDELILELNREIQDLEKTTKEEQYENK